MSFRRTLRWKNTGLVAIVAATVTLGGCAEAQDSEEPAHVAASSPAVHSTLSAAAIAGSTSLPPSTSTRQFTPPPPRSAAATARLPTGTPFDLLIHCGVKYLEYETKEYKAARPQDAPVRLPAPGASTVTETGYAHGYLQVINRHTIKFVVADPTVSIDGQTITFTSTSDTPLPCA